MDASLTTYQAIAIVVATASALVGGMALGARRGFLVPVAAAAAMLTWTASVWLAVVAGAAASLATLVGALLSGREPPPAGVAALAAGTEAGLTAATATWANPDVLTPREVEVLTLVAAGRSNEEIAADLVISISTVKTHINNLFSKTGVRDRAQAVRYAYEHGLAPQSKGGTSD